MFRVALIVFIVATQPVNAQSTFFTEPCNGDLINKLDTVINRYEIATDWPSERRADIPRLLGSRHAFCIDRLIIAAENMEFTNRSWSVNSLVQVIHELQWVQKLLRSDLKDIYEQAKSYEKISTKENTKIINSTAQVIALSLFQLLNKLKYLPVMFDYAQNTIKDFGYITPLEQIANGEYMPAMMDAARRHLEGDGINKNLGKAYYWMARIIAAQGDISSIIVYSPEQLFKIMTDEDNKSLLEHRQLYGRSKWL